jgi:ankyrin repeat protein
MPEISEMIEACSRAFDEEDWASCISHARAALALEASPDDVSQFKHYLATALFLRNESNTDEILEGASIYEDLLLSCGSASIEGIKFHRKLGATYSRLFRSKVHSSDIVNKAIFNYQQALAGGIPEPGVRASTEAQLAYAFIQLGGEHGRANHLHARRHFENALAIYTARQYPEEFAEVTKMLDELDAISRIDPENIFDDSLVRAATEGSLGQVQHLLNSGVHVDSRDSDGCTALQTAISEGFRDIAILLLDHGADPKLRDFKSFALLHWAVFPNDRTLVQLGYDPEVGIDPQDSTGRTPLSWAASEDWIIAIEWLLESKANIEISDHKGWSPLHFAAAAGKVNALEVLLKSGADATARCRLGDTPLDVAVRLGVESTAASLTRFLLAT